MRIKTVQKTGAADIAHRTQPGAHASEIAPKPLRGRQLLNAARHMNIISSPWHAPCTPMVSFA